MSYKLTIVLGDRHSCHCIPLKHLHTDIPESLNIIKSMHVPWQAMNSIKKDTSDGTLAGHSDLTSAQLSQGGQTGRQSCLRSVKCF